MAITNSRFREKAGSMMYIVGIRYINTAKYSVFPQCKEVYLLNVTC